MDFIQFEAIDESQQNEPLNFSDDEKTHDEDDFIDGSEQPIEDVSFYRKLDLDNITHFNKILNQTRDPMVSLYEDDEMFFGTEDTQPELYDPEDRESVKFNKFEGFEKYVQKFMDTRRNFENSGNPFFDLIVYGVMYRMIEGKVDLKKMKHLKILDTKG